MVKLSTGALYRSGVSLHLYPDQGEGSFSELANFPEVPDVGGRGLEYMPDVNGDDGAARAPYVCSLPLYTMETQTTAWVNNYS